jgi:hypothetical protein
MYFKQAAKLRYGVTEKEALKFVFHFGKENGVVRPESWVKNKFGGNMLLRGLRKMSHFLFVRKSEAAGLTRSTSFNLEKCESNSFFNLKKST